MALKKLRSDSEKAYERERSALFKILRLKHLHLIQVVASFSIEQDFYFLFPWATDGDLDRFWKENSTKYRTIEVIKWAFTQMKGLADGVRTLHADSLGENGRHGDLKPENILIFSDNVGELSEQEAGGESITRLGNLRITDAGLAKFHTQITKERPKGTTTTGGSLQYAPPEFLIRGSKWSRKYDCWSLGCIFLDFAIWLLGGYDEISRFRKARQEGGSDDAEYFYREKSRGKPSFGVLTEVSDFIRAARKHERARGETCFKDLFDIIEHRLLQVDENNRFDSKEMFEHLLAIEKKLLDADGSSYYFTGMGASLSGFAPQPLHQG